MGFFGKIFKEFKRVQLQLLGKDIFFPDAPKPKPDPLPIPDPPISQGQPGPAAAASKRKLIKAGRGGTILTGQLAPKKVGKKGLLG